MIQGAYANVLDYGASPSASSAENQTAFEAAIAASDSVFIPEGNYNITGPLYINGTGKKVVGAGMGATKLTITGAGAGVIIGNSVFTSETNHDIAFSDVWISGGTYALQVGSSTSPLTFVGEISRVKLTNATAGGLYLYQAIASFNDLAINNNYRGIVTLVAGGDPTASIFNRCRIYQNTNEGWYCETAWAFQFNECNFESNGKEGVKFSKNDGKIITNVAFNSCWFESNLTDGTLSSGNVSSVINGTSKPSVVAFTSCEFNGVTGSGSGNIHIIGYFDSISLINNRYLTPNASCVNIQGANIDGVSIGPQADVITSAQKIIVIDNNIKIPKGNLSVLSGIATITGTVNTTVLNVTTGNVAVDDGSLLNYYVSSTADTNIGGAFFNLAQGGIGLRRLACGTDTDRGGLWFGCAGVLNARMWADDSGIFRWNAADPTSATDGTVIGTQTFSGTHVYKAGDLDLQLGESVKLIGNKIYRTTSANDPTCCGIYAGKSSLLKTSFNEIVAHAVVTESGETIIVYDEDCGHSVISLGDTITDQNNIETYGVLVDCDVSAGDYLCTSNVPGKLTKQTDDLMHNYTIAKAMEDGNSSNPVYAYILS